MLGPREVAELLTAHGLDARRSLGQNFVVDPGTVEHIAALAGVGPDDHVVEVGPGLGSLTLALAATGASVVAVEKDRQLLPVLESVLESCGADLVEVVEADALDLDWSELLGSRSTGEWALVANLPYNVAVPILMSILERAPQVGRAVVMVQKEVAERLVAGPGGRTVGIPSIRVAWWARAEILGTVDPEVFVPRPRVTSALVGITRHAPPRDDVDPTAVLELAATAYRQRRKMLRSTIGSIVSADEFERAGIDPQLRPEQLSVADWADLQAARRR